MTPAEILEEAVSDRAIKDLKKQGDQKRWHERIDVLLEMAQLAIPAVLTAGAAGNVTCREAAGRILKLQEKLK